MNDLKLVNPCKQYLESYLEACRESKDENVESVHYKDPDKYDEWKNTLVQSAEDNSKGIGLPKDMFHAQSIGLSMAKTLSAKAVSGTILTII